MTGQAGNVTATVSVQIDSKKYSRLLTKTLPRAITTEVENERMLAIVDGLMRKGEDNLTPEEGALFDLLVMLIEKFEDEHYPEVGRTATPVSILKHIPPPTPAR
jgi:HTH-type transcriptional regulator/antitoxin HigA